jgi:hypothetical protein
VISDEALAIMSGTILDAFIKFAPEGAVVGRLLAGYTTLEIGLMACVQMVRDDFDAVLKAMFRVRSESQRINIADALGRHYYHDHKLGAQFEAAIAAIRHCLKIRNQYAHCAWYDDRSGRLAFVNIEDIATGNTYLTDLKGLTTYYVDLPLLQQQEAYFVYVDRLLIWVNHQGRIRAGKTPNLPDRPVPEQMKQPLLHI